jgi:hypothetical protein
MLVVAGMGGALVSLGVLLVGAAFSDEDRLLVSIAYVALGLFLLLVGGVMLWGGLLVLRDAWRARGRRTFSLSTEQGSASIVAGATIARGEVALHGTTVTRRALDDAPDAGATNAPLRPSIAALVRTLAVLHARGEASLALAESLSWTADAAGPPVRHTSVDVEASASAPCAPEPVDARDHILFALAEGATARGLAAALADDSDLRSAFEVYAARLSPDDADPRTMSVLAAIVDDGPAPMPYRQRGRAPPRRPTGARQQRRSRAVGLHRLELTAGGETPLLWRLALFCDPRSSRAVGAGSTGGTVEAPSHRGGTPYGGTSTGRVSPEEYQGPATDDGTHHRLARLSGAPRARDSLEQRRSLRSATDLGPIVNDARPTALPSCPGDLPTCLRSVETAR